MSTWSSTENRKQKRKKVNSLVMKICNIFVFVLISKSVLGQNIPIECKVFESAINHKMFNKTFFNNINKQTTITIVDKTTMMAACGNKLSKKVKIVTDIESFNEKNKCSVDLLFVKQVRGGYRLYFFKPLTGACLELFVSKRRIFKKKYVVNVIGYGAM
jgi:hypothetical protein